MLFFVDPLAWLIIKNLSYDFLMLISWDLSHDLLMLTNDNVKWVLVGKRDMGLFWTNNVWNRVFSQIGVKSQEFSDGDLASIVKSFLTCWFLEVTRWCNTKSKLVGFRMKT